MALRATEAGGGISDGAGWLLWPSSDDSEAVRHGFGGRSMVDGCFCCELCAKKYGTWYILSQKMMVRAAHFLNRSVRDLDVSFINKYQYLICRA
jgi:hypothetical protein